MNKKFTILFVVFTLVLSTAANACVLVVSATDFPEVTFLSPEDKAAEKPVIGDIVSTRPDDWSANDFRFGSGECKNMPPRIGGPFACLEVIGATQQEIRNSGLLRPLLDSSENKVVRKFRRFRIKWEDLPPLVRSDLFDRGFATIQATELFTHIEDKEAAK